MLGSELRRIWGFLKRRPALVVVAVLTLGLGIGANTAVFSVIDAVLLRPLPYAEPESLVVPVAFDRTTGNEWKSVTYPDFVDWREQGDLFEQVALLSFRRVDLTGDWEPEKVSALAVSEDYFPLTRALLLHGRLFVPSDFEAGAEQVVVLGDGLWRRRFGSRPDLVGETIQLNDRSCTVVGIVEARTAIPSTPEIWQPLDLGDPLPDWVMRRDNFFIGALLRMRPGVELETASARVSALADRVSQDLPAKRGKVGFKLVSLRDGLLESESRLALTVVLAAVGVVLVIACFNLANLLLVRAMERRKEFAVRMALGAGSSHLVWLLLTEGLALALLGGVAGLILGRWIIVLLRAYAPIELPGLEQLGLHGSVFGFAFAVSCLTALVLGLLPAWQVARLPLVEGLSDRVSSGGRSDQRTRSALVVLEIAVSLILLVGSGLMLRSLGQLNHRPTGIDVEQRLTFSVDLPRARYPEKAQRDAFFETLLEQLRALPQVKRVSASSMLPLGGRGVQTRRVHLVEGDPEPPDGPEHRAEWNVITQDYFRTIAVPVLKGRTFTELDSSNATPVVIINQAMAARMFPDQDPIGQRIRSWRDENLLREIVGVVGSVRLYGLGQEWQPMVYVPYTQVGWPYLYKVAIHTEGEPRRLVAAARAEVRRLDDKLPVTEILTMRELAAASIVRERTLTWVLGGFSALALILASLGLYGVVSYSVSQRRLEIGIRMAIGARPGDVLGMVVRQGLLLAAAGIGLGSVVALALSRFLETLLTDVSTFDPLTYLGVATVLLAVTVLAILGPARRATRVYPVEALRRG